MKIIFNNGTELNYSNVGDIIFTHEFAEGYNRETMTVTLDKDEIGLTELNNLLSVESNLGTIKLVADDGTENIYSDFVLKLKCGTERKLIDFDTQEYVEVIVFKLGKLVYIEKKLKELGVM